ncbi:hypothetical protein DFJ73DRAFT_807639 [Zopfochytrium polystomum]|nr:hypothetical protein DFJ73DRAFT_807639 [Zopfochytrium polystomum]
MPIQHSAIAVRAASSRITSAAPFSSSASAHATAASASAPAPPRRIVRLIDPRTEFRQQMRAIRRSYIEETEQLRQKRRAEQEEAKRRHAAAIEQQKLDIEAFKKSRAMGFDEGVRSVSGKSDNSWMKEYVDYRRKIRFETELNRQLKLSRRREESLLYLYYTSESFVTYANMEEKLAQAFTTSMYVTPEETSYEDVQVLARRRLVDQGQLTPQAAPPPMSELGWNPMDSHESRYQALQDAVRGTTGGYPGIDAIDEWMKEVEAKGGVEAVKQERIARAKEYRESREAELDARMVARAAATPEADLLAGFDARVKAFGARGKAAKPVETERCSEGPGLFRRSEPD